MVPGVSSSLALALAGFCFSVLFIAFVCSRLACALLRRRRRRARRAPDALPPHYAAYPAAVHAAAPGPAGLDPAAAAAFPTRAAQRAGGDGDSQCVICLSEYEEEEVLRILPYCGHDFHMACIDLWLQQNSTCPVCRISLLENPDSDHTPPSVPSVVISISPPSSPESSRSDPCRCLFASAAGHSSRASEAPRQEPDQENQVASGPSADGANNSVPLSEVKPPS
ncbi:hypothetical protein BS78_05G049600 [Paspalum vaginatum]|nr:hypothetical protein BS78_05G049600 [Paspalum vaginatum]